MTKRLLPAAFIIRPDLGCDFKMLKMAIEWMSSCCTWELSSWEQLQIKRGLSFPAQSHSTSSRPKLRNHFTWKWRWTGLSSFKMYCEMLVVVIWSTFYFFSATLLVLLSGCCLCLTFIWATRNKLARSISSWPKYWHFLLVIILIFLYLRHNQRLALHLNLLAWVLLSIQ